MLAQPKHFLQNQRPLQRLKKTGHSSPPKNGAMAPRNP
jgi:hypothetical protein